MCIESRPTSSPTSSNKELTARSQEREREKREKGLLTRISTSKQDSSHGQIAVLSAFLSSIMVNQVAVITPTGPANLPVNSPSPRSWREKLTMKMFQSRLSSSSSSSTRRHSNDDAAVAAVKRNLNNGHYDNSPSSPMKGSQSMSRSYLDDTQSNGSSGGYVSGADRIQGHGKQQHLHQHPNPAMFTPNRQSGARRGKRNASKRHTIDNSFTPCSNHSGGGDSIRSTNNARRSPFESPSPNYGDDSGGGGDDLGKSPKPAEKGQTSGILTRFILSRPFKSDEGGAGGGSAGDTCTRMTDDDFDVTATTPVSPHITRSGSGSLPPSGPRSGSATSLPSLPSIRMPFRRSTMDSSASSVPSVGAASTPGAGGLSASFASSAASVSSSGSSHMEPKEQFLSASKRSTLLASATTVLASSRNILQKQTSMMLPRRLTNDSFAASNHGTISVGGVSAGMSGSIHRRGGSIGGISLRRNSNSSGSVVLFGGGNSVDEELPFELQQADLQKRAEDLYKAGHLDEAIELWTASLALAEKNRESLAARTEILCILMDLHFQLSVQRQREEQDSPRHTGMSSGSAAEPSIYDDDDGEFQEYHHEELNDTYYSRMGYGDTSSPIPYAVTASIQPNSARRRSSGGTSLDNDPLDNFQRGSFHCITREDAEFHRQAAKQYAHRLKPAMVKSSWIGCTSELMNFLSEAEAWELALVVAEKIIQDSVYNGQRKQVDPAKLASIHFQVASQKLNTQRQGEALQHLQATLKNLQQLTLAERDMILYLQVLQLLATEYETQGMPKLALSTYTEELKYASKERQAHICCQMAEIYIAEKQLDMALQELEEAAKRVVEMGASEGSEDAQGTIRRQLLHTKGDVYFRLGRFDESMQVYQQALSESKYPAEKAKLLYTMGRLCIRLRRTRDAITCFTRELEITQQELGYNHLSVSRIYHELAKLYDEGLGEHKMALMKYNKALQIELAILQECQFGVASCHKCNPTSHRMCEMHANMHTSVMNQIRETKKCQGRMHFKLGDFNKALQTSFLDHQPSGGKRSRRRRQST